MVRAALLALLSTGCTLLVEHQLSQPGTCPDLILLDGSANNGGQRFHAGVTAPSFRGPAYPVAGKSADSFGSTLTFLSNGALELAGGYQGDVVFLRSEANYTATSASTTPGHEGPGGFGCAELLGTTYDALRDRTSLQLVTGGCGDDAITYDGGSFAGPPGPLVPAIAWAGLPDGGGLFAAVLGNQGQVCPESFPPSCFPPHGGTVPAIGARRLDALVDAQGRQIWIVATEGADTALYDSSFGPPIVAVSWSGPIAAVAADVGIVMRLHNGQLDGQLFDSTGAHRGNEAHVDLGDPAAHGLEIARLGSAPVVRAAWIGGDGKARVATWDASVASAQRLAAPSIVCGSQGAGFVAPTSSTTAAVLIGDALYLRHVD